MNSTVLHVPLLSASSAESAALIVAMGTLPSNNFEATVAAPSSSSSSTVIIAHISLYALIHLADLYIRVAFSRAKLDPTPLESCVVRGFDKASKFKIPPPALSTASNLKFCRRVESLASSKSATALTGSGRRLDRFADASRTSSDSRLVICEALLKSTLHKKYSAMIITTTALIHFVKKISAITTALTAKIQLISLNRTALNIVIDFVFLRIPVFSCRSKLMRFTTRRSSSRTASPSSIAFIIWTMPSAATSAARK
mmetsp:Transcript_2419/g.6535  ORF Transcript_2419/g.6535 Transcript_2419/m.6535 type:complete len:256 (+) Transcript_2419:1086-1853(+)